MLAYYFIIFTRGYISIYIIMRVSTFLIISTRPIFVLRNLKGAYKKGIEKYQEGALFRDGGK
jgi:hypothetical protein